MSTPARPGRTRFAVLLLCAAIVVGSAFPAFARGDRDSIEARQRTGPSRAALRGHDVPMRVHRRRATPIPRVAVAPRWHYDRDRSYRGSYRHRALRRHRRAYRHGHSVHHHHNYTHYSYSSYSHHHVHHAHCGHADWDHGDAFANRTLGRACIYGPNDEVIYKPADVVCAPPLEATPTAAEVGPGPAIVIPRTARAWVD